jgi:hypothetical protein
MADQVAPLRLDGERKSGQDVRDENGTYSEERQTDLHPYCYFLGVVLKNCG